MADVSEKKTLEILYFLVKLTSKAILACSHFVTFILVLMPPIRPAVRSSMYCLFIIESTTCGMICQAKPGTKYGKKDAYEDLLASLCDLVAVKDK